MGLVLLILGGFLVLVLINLYYRKETLKSLDREIKKEWKNLPREEYVKKSYKFIAERFTKVNKCWLKYPWRNFYFNNLWTFKGKSVPCHIQNTLFQRCLLKRFNKKEMKTIITKCFIKGIILHFYSRVKIREKWIDVDVWGKRRGIPFGKNVHKAKWKGG